MKLTLQVNVLVGMEDASSVPTELVSGRAFMVSSAVVAMVGPGAYDETEVGSRFSFV